MAVKAGIISIGSLPAGAALFAAAIEFIDSGPSPRFRGFHAQALFLVAGFDVFRLTFLFVSITGFIALRHSSFFLSTGTSRARFAMAIRFFSRNRRRL